MPTTTHPPLLSCLLSSWDGATAADDDENNSSTAGPASKRRSPQQDADSRWLETLSEPELDVLISLKELAVKQATEAGQPYIANSRFHLRWLRALGTVLLEDFKERLKQASPAGPSKVFEKLALLSDPGDADVSSSSSRSQPREDDDEPVPNGADKKRKQMMKDGSSDAPSWKRRKREE